MSLSDETTLRRLDAPTVLVIGCPEALVARCAQALYGVGALLVKADVVEAPTVAAARRPLAMVLTEDLYAFDPEEFHALARDVHASLVRVEEDVSAAKLELLLSVAVDAALERRRRAASARQASPPPPPSSRSGGALRRPSFTEQDAPPSSR